MWSRDRHRDWRRGAQSTDPYIVGGRRAGSIALVGAVACGGSRWKEAALGVDAPT
jgi:hypothetical protein